MPRLFRSKAIQWEVTLDCGHSVYVSGDMPMQYHDYKCATCEIEREKANREINDTLHNVAIELKHRGVQAEYYHSGGGCMVVRCEVSPGFEWMFGLADVCWGGDFSSDDDGHLFAVESSYPADTKIETVADWIWAYLSLPPFVDPATSILIKDPYWDATSRKGVNPWTEYGIPYPPSTMDRDLKETHTCSNCTEQFSAVTHEALCTRCLQPSVY